MTYKPSDGRNISPLTLSEIRRIYRRIVVNRDNTVCSLKAARGYFRNEVKFISSSRALWRTYPDTGGIPHLINDLDTPKHIADTSRHIKAATKEIRV